MRAGMSKADMTRLHAGTRAAERYGEVPPPVWDAIRKALRRADKQLAKLRARRIPSGMPYDTNPIDVHLEKLRERGVSYERRHDPNGRIRARVTVEARVYRVVWDPYAQAIVTFLPLEDTLAWPRKSKLP